MTTQYIGQIIRTHRGYTISRETVCEFGETYNYAYWKRTGVNTGVRYGRGKTITACQDQIDALVHAPTLATYALVFSATALAVSIFTVCYIVYCPQV